MSATPRPWVVHRDLRRSVDDPWHICIHGADEGWGGDIPIRRVVATMDGVEPDENAALIMRAVNAFDALLAVAKAGLEAAEMIESEWNTRAEIGEALDALDAAHPDWRTW